MMMHVPSYRYHQQHRLNPIQSERPRFLTNITLYDYGDQPINRMLFYFFPKNPQLSGFLHTILRTDAAWGVAILFDPQYPVVDQIQGI